MDGNIIPSIDDPVTAITIGVPALDKKIMPDKWNNRHKIQCGAEVSKNMEDINEVP